MTTSANKGYNLQTTGTNNNTWGIVLNSNLSIIDNNLGGTLTLSVAGNTNITVTTAQAQNLIHNLSGALTGNIQYILPQAGGFYIISNGTSGSFSLTVAATGCSGSVVIPQGTTTMVYVDATGLVVAPVVSGTTQTQISAASATTTNLGAVGSANILITGTTTITSFGSSATTSLPFYRIQFNGALTLTYNATSMILPGAANILTAANDTAIAQYLGSGNWQIISYTKATGVALSMTGPSTTVASATTTDLHLSNTNSVIVSGTTTITSFGSNANINNPIYFLRFTGSLALTYNATSLILPGGVNIMTVAGDTAIAEYLGSGNWQILEYGSANGSVQPLQVANSNFLCNGGFDVWQENTSTPLTTSVAYGCADQWAFIMAASAAATAQIYTASVPLGFTNCLKLGRTAASSLTNPIYVMQVLETVDSIKLAGEIITVSYWAKIGANFSGSGNNIALEIQNGTGTDQSVASFYASSWTGKNVISSANQVLTTTWTRYTKTVTVPSGATQLGILFGYTPTGTASADDNVYITGVKLEIGSFATGWLYRSFQEELARCKRYWTKTFPYSITPAQNTSTITDIEFIGLVSNGLHSTIWQFDVEMRGSPSVTTYSPNASSANWSTNVNTPIASTGTSSPKGVALRASTAVTVGSGYTIQATASARL